jgi:CDP-glycerol glycerophosphotransferase (TagB/SpsB family)
MEWGAVSTKIGVPHILVNREGQMASSPYLIKKLKRLFRDALPKFEGNHIIIQNELDKQIYVDTGYVSPEKISSLGCPRMDDFIKTRNEKKRSTGKSRKKVVFFPFFWFSDFEKKDLFSYFCKLHLCLVDFAIHHPEIDVIMKPKQGCFLSWKKNIFDETVINSNVDLSKIPNLIISDELDLHSLFFESDVVCGLNSSALLEAAVIGLPVIIPYFKDLQNRKYEERVFYRDAYDLFDIAESVEGLESLILKRLQNPVIDRGIMERRGAYFEKHISSLRGGATEKHVALIKRVVLGQQSKRVSYK